MPDEESNGVLTILSFKKNKKPKLKIPADPLLKPLDLTVQVLNRRRQTADADVARALPIKLSSTIIPFPKSKPILKANAPFKNQTQEDLGTDQTVPGFQEEGPQRGRREGAVVHSQPAPPRATLSEAPTIRPR